MNSGQNIQSIRPLQLIAGALMTGVTMFLIVALVIDPGAAGENNSMFLIALAAAGVPAIAGSIAVRMIFSSKIREELREARHAGDHLIVPESYQRSVLFSTALIEAFGLFGVIVYFLTRDAYALIAVGLALGLMLWYFPTQSKLDDMAAEA